MRETERAIIAAMLGCALLMGALAESALAQAPIGRRESVAPTRVLVTRPRTRIRVTPAYPYRTFSTDYPVPYKYEYPGPGFVRQCTSWLAPENRVSGPVVVPRMRCWWQPGRSDLKSYP